MKLKKNFADLCMTYPLPYQTEKYSEEDCRDDYFKLKGIRWNEIMVEGQEWFQRQSRESKYPLTYEGNPLFSKDIM